MDQLETLLEYLTPNELAELDALLADVDIPVWSPLFGPQTEAYNCDADELFYGGAAGGGKTDLLLGTALQQHWRSIIFRREFQQLKGIRDRGQELFADIAKYNGADLVWRVEDGRRIELGACQYDGDEQKYQGRPHDLKAFDEITHFTKKQFMFLKGWNRTTKINPQTGEYYRSRVVAAGNPPTTAEGQWVTDYWAPWLDPNHPNPAKPGELRWFITNSEGEDQEVSSSEPVYMLINGQETAVRPRSRTFIRARIQDNPFLLDSGYLSVLQALPEPLRSRMLQGDFGVGEDDDKWQVIPTAWIYAAQARWAPTYEEYLVKLATVRKAQAEAKNTTEAPINGDPTAIMPAIAEKELDPFDKLIQGFGGYHTASKMPEGAPSLDSLSSQPPSSENPFSHQYGAGGLGVDTSALLTPEQRQLNRDAAALLLNLNLPGSKEVGVDVSRGGRDKTVVSERIGAWFAALKLIPGAQTPDGPSVVDKLIELGYKEWKCKIDVVGVGSSPVDVGRMRGMDVVPMNGANASVGRDRSGTLEFANARSEWLWVLREALDPALGLNMAIPLDSDLAADLAAPRWRLTPRGIQVEDKAKVKERLGRSPDKGDAIVNAFAQPSIPGQGFLAYYREESRRALDAISSVEGARR